MRNIYIILGIVLAGIIIFFIAREINTAKPSSEEAYSLAPKDAARLPVSPTNMNTSHLVTIETTMGSIQFETYDADAPNTVKNFITLAGSGFYKNLTFHRVIKGFMIQGGDPNGNGTGGPGYTFKDELNPETESYRQGYKKGVVAMANAGPDTNGSQFFIMLEDYSLPPHYTIFGKVVKGQDVVDAIGNIKTDSRDMPETRVVMKRVSVEEVIK